MAETQVFKTPETREYQVVERSVATPSEYVVNPRVQRVVNMDVVNLDSSQTKLIGNATHEGRVKVETVVERRVISGEPLSPTSMAR